MTAIFTLDAQDLAQLLTDAAERDADLAAWAVRWLGIDLAAFWRDLGDEARDALVEAGVVEEVEADVECIEAESWQSDWREENGAAWPTYTLRLSAEGMDDIDVDGWHLVGWLGPDGNRRYHEWATDDSDGVETGLPRVDGWEIEPGANMRGGGLIPCWLHDGQLYTLDRDALCGHGALSDAASTADHGGCPTWEDVTDEDMEVEDTVYVVREGRVVEVDILRGSIAGEGRYDYGRDRYVVEYDVEAWAHSLDADTTYETRDDCEAALREECGDIHEREDGATLALWASIIDEHGEPDDYEVGTDRPNYSGVHPYIVVDGERCDLDADDLATLLADGWEPIIATYEEAVLQSQFYGIRHLTGQFLGTPDDLPFSRAVDAATSREDKIAALAIFADWLEERGDERYPAIRQSVARLMAATK